MRSLAILLSFLACSGVYGFKTNRTSCFHYISCLESIQTNLKQCVGGTAISLALEAKDVNIRDLVKYRALEFVGCQDRLLKEIVDFEALQVLVNEDARECFEKLPESSKRIEPFTDSCDYVQSLSRNSSKGDSLQCLIEYKQDREYCESLLECCPDHTRCGERMNAVSLSYQNARVKAEQIVYNMISCIVSNDPRFMREGARLQSLRDPYRNAGVPFLRPDAYTEARITRRLALTSTITLAQRRERFLKKYSQVRQLTAQKLVNQYTTTTIGPVEDLVAETSETAEEEVKKFNDDTTKVVKKLDTENEDAAEKLEDEELEDEKKEETKVTVPRKDFEEEPERPKKENMGREDAVPEVPLKETETEKQPEGETEITSDQRVQTVRNLIRTASDKDLSKYVALISEGKFTQLFNLAAKKQKTVLADARFDDKLTSRLGKLKDIITKALNEKSSEVDQIPEEIRSKIVETRSSDGGEEAETKEEKEESIPTLFTISDSVEPPKPKKTEKKAKNLMAEARLAHTTVDRALRNIPEVDQKKDTEAGADVKPSKTVKKSLKKKVEKNVTDEEPEAKELTGKDRALLVESEIKQVVEESKKTDEEEPKKDEKEDTKDEKKEEKKTEEKTTEEPKEVVAEEKKEDAKEATKEETKEEAKVETKEETTETTTEAATEAAKEETKTTEVTKEAKETKEVKETKEPKKETVDEESSTMTIEVDGGFPKLAEDSNEKKDRKEEKDALAELVNEMKESIETSTPVAPELTATLKSELISNLDEVLTTPQAEMKRVSGGDDVIELKTETISEADVEGSGVDVATTTETAEIVQPTTSDVIQQVKQIRPRAEQTHCQEYASCWQTLIDYEQQCDRKYSTEVLSHGIDDAEILSILHNSSISHHEIVLKACLRPLDRSVHSTLKQLLVIQRGVRKACLDLGRNKIAVTELEERQCNAQIPSTSFVDEFLSSVHVRSQENHLKCRAKLEPIREACTIVRNCCASVETCDNYIASSPVKKLETEAIRRLVKRQNDCETKMLQTLTYIHEQLSSPSRRRRFYYH